MVGSLVGFRSDLWIPVGFRSDLSTSDRFYFKIHLSPILSIEFSSFISTNNLPT